MKSREAFPKIGNTLYIYSSDLEFVMALVKLHIALASHSKQAHHGAYMLTERDESTAPLLDNKGVFVEQKEQAALQR